MTEGASQLRFSWAELGRLHWVSLGMRRALLSDDYKKIFEGRNVSRLYGNHPIWGKQPVKRLEEKSRLYLLTGMEGQASPK